jgi:hypothetical protein
VALVDCSVAKAALDDVMSVAGNLGESLSKVGIFDGKKR